MTDFTATTIRTLTAEDVWQCTEICKRSGLRLWLEPPIGLVAESDGRVVGFCRWVERFRRNRWCLTDVVVEPAERQRGVGRSLIADLQRVLPIGHALEIVLHPENREAAEFLRRCGLGFTPSGRDAGMTAWVWGKPAADAPPESGGHQA